MTEGFDLAHLIRNQTEAEVVCENPRCRHVARLNLSTLASRFGGRTILAQLEGRLRCEACRGRKVRLRLLESKDGVTRSAG